MDRKNKKDAQRGIRDRGDGRSRLDPFLDDYPGAAPVPIRSALTSSIQSPSLHRQSSSPMREPYGPPSGGLAGSPPVFDHRSLVNSPLNRRRVHYVLHRPQLSPAHSPIPHYRLTVLGRHYPLPMQIAHCENRYGLLQIHPKSNSVPLVVPLNHECSTPPRTYSVTTIRMTMARTLCHLSCLLLPS